MVLIPSYSLLYYKSTKNSVSFGTSRVLGLEIWEHKTNLDWLYTGSVKWCKQTYLCPFVVNRIFTRWIFVIFFSLLTPSTLILTSGCLWTSTALPCGEFLVFCVFFPHINILSVIIFGPLGPSRFPETLISLSYPCRNKKSRKRNPAAVSVSAGQTGYETDGDVREHDEAY